MRGASERASERARRERESESARRGMEETTKLWTDPPSRRNYCLRAPAEAAAAVNLHFRQVLRVDCVASAIRFRRRVFQPRPQLGQCSAASPASRYVFISRDEIRKDRKRRGNPARFAPGNRTARALSAILISIRTSSSRFDRVRHSVQISGQKVQRSVYLSRPAWGKCRGKARADRADEMAEQ